MPGLKLCGKRCSVGSDDFVFSGLLDLIVRIPWILIVSIVYTQHIQQSPCLQVAPLEIYIHGSLACFCIISLVSILLVSQSMKGSVMDCNPRWLVPHLFIMRILLTAFELGFNVIGSYCVFTVFQDCRNEVTAGLLITGLVTFNWIILSVTVIWIVVVLDPVSESLVPHDLGASSSLSDSNVWESRFQKAFCWSLKHDREKEVFKEVAVVLKLLFSGQDLVVSDVAAGLILLHHHSSMKEEFDLVPEVNNLTDLDLATRSPWMTVDCASHFIKFAFGSYGWPWFFYSNFWTGFCKICPGIRCCSCRRRVFSPVGDNCCLCHYASLKRVTNLKDEDILYVSFHNSVYEVPFYVSIDHSTCNVVVAIRGTLSLHDLLTDMSAQSEELRLCTTGQDEHSWAAHKGMTYAATYIRNSLEDNRVLDQAFASYPTFGLMVVGHSLGGGTAAILAMMLRTLYPSTKCIAYSPPGLLCRSSSSYCADFVMSVVVGDDLIPRMSIASLQRLRYQLCEELESCRMPKYKILIDGCWKAVFGYSKKSLVNLSPSQVSPLLQDDRLAISYNIDVSETVMPRTECPPHLYVPGCVLHIKPDSDGSKDYISEWVNPEKLTQIVVSPRMLADHLPDQVLKILTSMASP